MPLSLNDRFRGCLLGLAVGDALGGCFEAQSSDWIAQRFSSPQSIIDNPPVECLSYTDDTQMAIGVAECLAERAEIDETSLCHAFVRNYVPSRGYGFGARRVLEAMEEGQDYKAVAESHFPGGSFGNGAAMRVAPVGLLFHGDLEMVWQQARLSALPTHLHPLGIEGAQLLATAVALTIHSEKLDRGKFLCDLRVRCQSTEFRSKLEELAQMRSDDDLIRLGNGIRALESVITAIGCFFFSPDCYGTTIGRAIMLGGDTDTIACMAGAISGAYLGFSAIPPKLLDRLENHKGYKGRTYIEELAEKLYHRFQQSRQSS